MCCIGLLAVWLQATAWTIDGLLSVRPWGTCFKGIFKINFYSRTYIWNCHLQHAGHFVQASKHVFMTKMTHYQFFFNSLTQIFCLLIMETLLCLYIRLPSHLFEELCRWGNGQLSPLRSHRNYQQKGWRGKYSVWWRKLLKICSLFLYYLLHDWPWISPWIKLITNEIDINFHVAGTGEVTTKNNTLVSA